MALQVTDPLVRYAGCSRSCLAGGQGEIHVTSFINSIALIDHVVFCERIVAVDFVTPQPDFQHLSLAVVSMVPVFLAAFRLNRQRNAQGDG